MPKALEDKLRKQGTKKGYEGDRLESFIYSIMTSLQKKGKIEPWRKLK